MKIAIPLAGDELCMHFGHCEQFAFVDVDDTSKAIQQITLLIPPPHAPGVIPRWIIEQNATHAIVGGMGGMAQQILASGGVQVITGAMPDKPENLVKAWLAGELECGDNVCDHDHHDHSCGGH